jgi:hypothetical protein
VVDGEPVVKKTRAKTQVIEDPVDGEPVKEKKPRKTKKILEE